MTFFYIFYLKLLRLCKIWLLILNYINFINEIIENCFIKSFYFLYKIDNTILNTYDINNNNFLHNISEKNKYRDMITLLLKLDDSLLFKKNKLGETPLIKHAKHKN